ncbi:MAG: guanylate kinase [Acidobacteriia bacterium]|nr:guanylate kinase [Terriglobia bacterium]
MARGILFVISAPSGTGKSSVAKRVLSAVPGIRFSVSYTTRPRRAGEVDGREYHFVDDARFDAMAASSGFLEWAHVFGRRYGTGRDATEAALGAGLDLLLDIDVQGARKVRECGIAAVSVFLLPPDYATLESRLRSRASDAEEQIATRLALARREAAEYRHYDYLVINDRLERAADDLRSVVTAERLKAPRLGAEAEEILATFPSP